MNIKSLICLLLILILFGVSCSFVPSQNVIYLIPKDYKGDVIILFNQPDGITPYIENGVFVFKIPEDGILRIKTEGIKKIANSSYFYLENNNERQELKRLRITGDRDPSGKQKDKFDGVITQEEYENGIFIMSYGGLGSFQTKRGNVQFTNFIVGNPKDSEIFYDKMQQRISQLQRQIMND